jgi:Family of unknown function (DUF6496)
VKSRKQAIAIGLSEARKKGVKVPQEIKPTTPNHIPQPTCIDRDAVRSVHTNALQRSNKRPKAIIAAISYPRHANSPGYWI